MKAYSSDASKTLVEAVALIPITFILAVLFAGVVLSQNLLCLMTGIPCKILTVTAKILSALFAIFALICVILVLAAIADTLHYIPKGYSITMSAGSIVFAVFAVANLCVPAGKSKPIETQEQQ